MSNGWDDPTESIMGGFDDKSWELDIDFARLPPTRSAEEMSADGALAELWPQATRAGLTDPDFVVFDPMGFSLADQLARIGFQVRVATSGVDVMVLVAAQPTGAVICGPAEDAERRRLLTAALRLRFPAIPIVYVSTHARNPAAVKGAKAEGAAIVVPLPLPSPDEVRAELGSYARAIPPPVLPDPGTGPIAVDDSPATLMLTADELEVQKQKWNAMAPAQPRPSPASPQVGARSPGASPANQPPANQPPPMQPPPTQPPSIQEGGIPAYAQMTQNTTPRRDPPPVPMSDEGHTVARMMRNQGASLSVDALSVDARAVDALSLDVEPTNPSRAAEDMALGFDSEIHTDLVVPLRAADAVKGAVTVTRVAAASGDISSANPAAMGEVGALLNAISPFLWGLEDAASFVQALADDGDTSAATHARTLQLLTKLLTQLKERVDGLGL